MAGELLVRRGSHPDVIVARARYAEAVIAGSDKEAIRRLRELVDVIRADPRVAAVWGHRTVSHIELYAVADAVSGNGHPSREDEVQELSLLPREDFVRVIRTEADAEDLRGLIAPGQVWVRWDEVSGEQAEIVRGLADAMWRNGAEWRRNPEARRLRLQAPPSEPKTD
jgi:hypothetical protein